MSQRTALVVDDSRSARFALRKYLEHHAFKVDTAESARAAYHWLESQTPDLIFLDHVMPGEDGFEALRRLKADPRTAGIPVVICSSNEGGAFVAEARSQGAADVLQKPPSPAQLKRVLQHVEVAVAAQDDNEPISMAEDETGGLKRYLEPAAPPPAAKTATRPAPVAARDQADVVARISLIEERLSALERGLAEVASLRQQFDGDLRAIHRQFDEALAAGLKTAREQAVAEIREALLRALRS